MNLFEEEKLPFQPSKNYIAYSKSNSEFEKKAILSKVFKSYKLSASHLNTYLKCPFTFLNQYFLKVKFPPNKAMLKGTIVHSVLDWIFKELKKDNSYPLEKAIQEEFISISTKECNKVTVFLTDEELGNIYRLIIDYFDSKKDKWNKIALTEFYVQKIIWNNVPLTGFIDKIEFDGNQINIVDYKTGNIVKALSNENYKRQMLFYTILIENYKPTWKVKSTQLSLVAKSENDIFIDKVSLVTEKEKAEIKQLIFETYFKISNFEFEKCVEASCYWCNK